MYKHRIEPAEITVIGTNVLDVYSNNFMLSGSCYCKAHRGYISYSLGTFLTSLLRSGHLSIGTFAFNKQRHRIQKHQHRTESMKARRERRIKEKGTWVGGEIGP